MLALIGSKTFDLLINLGIRKVFLTALKRFCIFYLVSLELVRTYAKRSNTSLSVGIEFILNFLWVPGTVFFAQKLVPDSFCWATYECHGWRALHSMPTSSKTIRISEEVRTSTNQLGTRAYVGSWNQNGFILVFALQKFCNSLSPHMVPLIRRSLGRSCAVRLWTFESLVQGCEVNSFSQVLQNGSPGEQDKENL